MPNVATPINRSGTTFYPGARRPFHRFVLRPVTKSCNEVTRGWKRIANFRLQNDESGDVSTGGLSGTEARKARPYNNSRTADRPATLPDSDDRRPREFWFLLVRGQSGTGEPVEFRDSPQPSWAT